MIEDESPVIKSLSFVLIEQSPIHFMSPSTNIHTFDLTGTSRDSLYEIWKIINRQYYPCCYIVPDIAHKYICLLYFLYFILNKYMKENIMVKLLLVHCDLRRKKRKTYRAKYFSKKFSFYNRYNNYDVVLILRLCVSDLKQIKLTILLLKNLWKTFFIDLNILSRIPNVVTLVRKPSALTCSMIWARMGMNVDNWICTLLSVLMYKCIH